MHSDVSSYVWDLSETIARLLAGFFFKIFLEIQHFAKYKNNAILWCRVSQRYLVIRERFETYIVNLSCGGEDEEE